MAKNTRNTDNEQSRGERRPGKGAAVAEREPLEGRDDARPQLREDASLGQAPETPNASVSEAPSADAIARRAFELYQERGGLGGEEMQDWLRAESELSGRRRP